MKKIGLTLSLVLALCGSAMAHGCWHVCGFWPSFSIGVGLGGAFGCSVACPCCCCTCGYPYPAYSYVYAQPSYPYAYAPAANYFDPPAAVPSPARAPELTGWVPSTRGAGGWVPDPTPYSYRPPVSATGPAQAKPALRQVVTSTCSPEGIPVYTISYVK